MVPLDTLLEKGYRLKVRGVGRVARYLYGSSPVRTVPTTLGNLPWEADPLDAMDIEVLRSGRYEPEVTGRLLEVLAGADVFWDIGANAGVHAVSVKVTKPEVDVIAFEPSPLRYIRLVRNAILNGTVIAAYCIALADEPGYKRLAVIDTGNSGLTSLQESQKIQYERVMPCWCDTGDRLVAAGAPSPNVIKIDVEGSEALVIRGMTKLMADPRLRHIIFEAPADRDPSTDAAARLLQEAGFAIELLVASRWGVNYHARRA